MNKRHAMSPAYIDSSLVTGYLLGVILFSVWIAAITQNVINPVWLGVATASVAIYQMLIYWLLRQYWEPDKIFFIFTTNIASLSIILLAVGLMTGIQLPADLPVFSVIIWLAGLQATVYDPGLVAVSYALIALITGLLGVFFVALFDDSPVIMKLKKVLGLARLDLLVDKALDKYSFWMDRGSRAWLVTPLVLLILLSVIVVGGAGLI